MNREAKFIALNEFYKGDSAAVMKALQNHNLPDESTLEDLFNIALNRKIQMIDILNPEYPNNLKETPLAPLVLYEYNSNWHPDDTVITTIIRGVSFTSRFPKDQKEGLSASSIKVAKIVTDNTTEELIEAVALKGDFEILEKAYIYKVLSTSDFFIYLKKQFRDNPIKTINSILSLWISHDDGKSSLMNIMETIEHQLQKKGE